MGSEVIAIGTPTPVDWPPNVQVSTREPLSRHTYMGIGGPADYFAVVDDRESLRRILDLSHERSIRRLVVGEGSNLLVSDQGFRGLVIKNASKSIADLGSGLIRADSGALMGRLARWSAERGLTGLEFGVGIPGTLGGSVFGNAGCFGTEIKDILQAARVWVSGEVTEFDNSALEFGYRTSRLSKIEGHPVVIDATLRCRPDSAGEAGGRITEFSRMRRGTQPATRSAGSVFRNPGNDYAGRLVEAAGLKGRRRGNAVISRKHANFIVNEGGATAQDVWGLIGDARAAVKEQFNVDLELEIQLIGEGFGDDR